MSSLIKRLDTWCGLRSVDMAWAARLTCAVDGSALVPCCAGHLERPALMEAMTSWRNENQDAFTTQFETTVEGVKLWLRQRVLQGDRVLFFVVPRGERSNPPIGHVGLRSYRDSWTTGELEIENVVRGVPSVSPGIMARAVRTLLGVCENGGAVRQRLSVFERNTRAISFFRRLGFADCGSIELRRRERGRGIVTYDVIEEGDTVPPDRRLVSMLRGQRPV